MEEKTSGLGALNFFLLFIPDGYIINLIFTFVNRKISILRLLGVFTNLELCFCNIIGGGSHERRSPSFRFG